jgi:hypothetical protein
MNFPLANANHSSADANAGWVSKICAYLEISDLGNCITNETPTRFQCHKRCRCLFKGKCPVMTPRKVLSLDLGSLTKYFVKLEVVFFK